MCIIQEANKIKISSRIARITQDEGHELQMQVGIHLMKVDKLYSSDVIVVLPTDAKFEAMVQNQ